MFENRDAAPGSRSESPGDVIELFCEVLGPYFQALSHVERSPGTVADEAHLPFAKPVIKAALRRAIRGTDDELNRLALRAAYVKLADFQPGVGPTARVLGDALPGVGSPEQIASLGPCELLALLRQAGEADALRQTAAAECVQLLRELDEDERRQERAAA